MKKIEATIPVMHAHEIIDQLRGLEIENLTTSDVTVIALPELSVTAPESVSITTVAGNVIAA